MHVISGPWWGWLLRGIAAIIFGVLAMLWPGITFLVFVAMFAARRCDLLLAPHFLDSRAVCRGEPTWRHQQTRDTPQESTRR